MVRIDRCHGRSLLCAALIGTTRLALFAWIQGHSVLGPPRIEPPSAVSQALSSRGQYTGLL